MQSWLSDNALAVGGIAVGLIGAGVAVLVYIWQRQPKTLDYSIVSSGPLLSDRAEAANSGLDVIYEGKVVEDPHILTMRLSNTGKVPILEEDFVQPVRIETTGKLLDVNVVGGTADGIVNIIHMTEANGTEPYITLLNAKDFVDLQFLLDGGPAGVKVSARFVGQTRPMQLREPFNKRLGGRAAQHAAELVAAGSIATGFIALLGVVTKS